MNIYTTILVEFLFISTCILLLFRLRSQLGLAPLYLLLGSVKFSLNYLDSTLGFSFLGDYVIYPGSVVLFSAVLFAVLLIYIKEGVSSARILIVGIVISNFIVSVLFDITYAQESIITHANSNLNLNTILTINNKSFIIGNTLLFFDFFFLVILYQYLISKPKKLPFFLIVFLPLLTVLIFDATIFNLFKFYGTSLLKNSLISQIICKSISALIFSIILYLYLVFFERGRNKVGFIADQERDILSILIYKKKYLNLKVEKNVLEQKLISQLDSTLNNISDGFVSLDTNWHYTFVNKAAGDILKRTPSSLIGKHIWTDFPEGVGSPLYKAFNKAVETQKTQYHKEYFEPVDKWIENRIYPTNEGITVYFTDITESKKAEELIVKNERYLNNIINNITDPIFIKDEQSKLQLVNEAFCKIFNVSKCDVLGKTLAENVTPKEKDAFLRIDKHVLSTGIENINEETLTIKGIETRIISTKKSRFFDANGNKILIGIIRDITEQKKNEESIKESEEKFSKAFESNTIGKAILNKDKKIIEINEVLLKIFGSSKEDVLWKRADELDLFNFDKDKNQENETIIWDLFNKNGSVSNIELKYIVPPGKEVFLLVSLKSLQINNEDHVLVTILNITEKKQAEIELEKHRNNLEELVQLRTDQLEKEKLKAQSADLIKSAFLATMSHELRTPMNSIIGFTSILLKEFAGPLNEEQAKQLGMVNKSAQHLLSLINDILDISKIEAGELIVTYNTFNYVSLLESTISFIKPLALKKEININLEISEKNMMLLSDERRVEQVLLNLVTNAIKFSNNGIITIKVNVENHMLITQIIDEGIGISDENLDKLFRPFIQINEGLSRSHEGTGLGLSISKSLIEKLGGTIQVTSKLGKGSNFTFILPLKQN